MTCLRPASTSWRSIHRRRYDSEIPRSLDSVNRAPHAVDHSDRAVAHHEPEPLGQNLSGCWSRWITDERRLVYTVDGDSVVIIQARVHY